MSQLPNPLDYERPQSPPPAPRERFSSAGRSIGAGFISIAGAMLATGGHTSDSRGWGGLVIVVGIVLFLWEFIATRASD
jgi:hypothetical protein